MPIKQLQPRLAQVGAIRLGEQKINPKTNKPYPSKLLTFRFTTPSQRIATAVAELFGGTPQPWRNTTGPEWEVYSTATEIAVLVPPQLVDPNFEMWGPGVQLRLCDGETERIRREPCLCAADYGQDFTRTAPKTKVCKVTFRTSLMIADLPSLGTWKLEGHGWGAAAEIPATVNAIRNAPMPLPGRLLLVHKKKGVFNPRAEKGKEIEQRDYVQPVLDISAVTPMQAYTNQLDAAARKALGGVEEQPALAAGPARTGAAAQQPSTAQWIAQIGETTDPAALDALMDRMKAAGVSDAKVVEAWKAQAAKVRPVAQLPAKTRTQGQAPATAPAGEVIEAEWVDDTTMTGAQAWPAALEFAGTKGWNVPTLTGKFIDHYGIDFRDERVTDAMLVEFLELLKSGEIS